MSKASLKGDTPELDTDTIESMEKGASSNGIGQQRRICLLTMGRSLEQLHQCSKDMPDLFNEFLSASKDFRDHAKALLELAEAAVFRLELSNAHGSIAAIRGNVGKKVGKKGGAI